MKHWKCILVSNWVQHWTGDIKINDNYLVIIPGKRSSTRAGARELSSNWLLAACGSSLSFLFFRLLFFGSFGATFFLALGCVSLPFPTLRPGQHPRARYGWRWNLTLNPSFGIKEATLHASFLCTSPASTIQQFSSLMTLCDVFLSSCFKQDRQFWQFSSRLFLTLDQFCRKSNPEDIAKF